MRKIIFALAVFSLIVFIYENFNNKGRVFIKNGVEYLVNPDYLIVGCKPPASGEDRLFPKSGNDPSLDCIASIDRPKFVDKEESGDFLSDDELVIGVNYKNKQRAYPIKNIFKHEIVNDKFEGDPILVTYCPLNGAGVVFERKVKNTPVKFGVSGRLYNNDLVIYDRKSGSLWLQVTGVAIAGPLIGEKLRQVPAEVVSWRTWRGLYPNTLVLKQSGKVQGPSEKFDKIFASYEKKPNVPFPLAPIGNDFPNKSWFRGIVVKGEAKAYSQSLFENNYIIGDTVGGKPITIYSDPKKKRVRFFDENMNQVPDIRLYWFSWKSIYPETKVY